LNSRVIAEKNLKLSSMLIADLEERNLESELTKGQIRTSKRLWSDVDGRRVLEFVEQFKTVDGANRSSSKNLSAYIRDLLFNQNPELTSWSVALIGREFSEELGKEDFGLGLGLGRISRSLDEGSERSVGVLVNPLNLTEGKLKGDEIIDFSQDEIDSALQYRAENQCSSSAATRITRPKSRGLLLLYPISPSSRPEAKNAKTQKTLGEAIFGDPLVQTTLIGLSIVFPHSELDIKEYWRQRMARERAV